MTLKAKFSTAVAIVLASLALNTVPTARADSLLPGTTDSSPSSIVTTGTLLADTGLQAFSFVGDTGTVSELVVQDFATGGMDFIYQVSVASGLIGSLTGYNFAGYTTNVGYGLPGSPYLQCGASISCSGTVAPFSIMSSTGGSVITFNFNPNVSGAITYALEIQTNASGYTAGSIGLIDGGGQTLNGYAPTGATVPEPSSMLLLGAGLLLTPFLGLKRAR